MYTHFNSYNSKRTKQNNQITSATLPLFCGHTN